MSRQERVKSTGFLESLFKGSSKKNAPINRPGSLANSRPNSETDLGDPDENVLEQQINEMDEKQTNSKFEEMLNDMNLNEEKKKPLRDSTIEYKKKMLIMRCKGANQVKESKFDTPQQYISYIENYSRTDTLNPGKILSCVESLRIALTNNTLSWVHEFGTRGLLTVFNILDMATRCNKDERFEKIQAECLKCIYKFINNTEGIREFLKHDKGHEIIARCIDYKKPIVTIHAVQLLAALCLLNNDEVKMVGSDKALSAITKMAEERNVERFKPLVEGLTNSNNDDLWCACLQFINALLSQTDVFEYRMHLRNEIVRCGLNDKLDTLKCEANKDILKQLECFENHKEEDADELQSRFDNVKIEMDDINDCFEVLKNTILDTPAEPYFLSILQHLLFVRDDYFVRTAYYKLIEELVTQIVLHKSGVDPDFTKRPVAFDIQPLLEGLTERTTEIEKNNYGDLQKRLEEALAEKSEALAKLEILGGNGGRSEGKLDPVPINKVSNVIGGPPPPPPLPGMGAPPSNVGGGAPPPPPLPNIGGGPPPPPMPGMGGPPPPPMPGMGGPPPPPLPGMGGPPPPPPPGMGPVPMPGMVPLLGMANPNVLPHGLKPKKKWDVLGPLKRANWEAIIPQKLSEKSFWVKVQEEKLASPDILEGLAQKFSSRPPPKKVEGDSIDSNNFGTLKKVKELKVLDSKTAQNILILLNGSLKHMSYDDIKISLLRCDDSLLSGNVLEQLIQYLPPADQLNKLTQYKDSYKDLTEAEQFCIKISEIKRLLPRLKSLSFKERFSEMVSDCKPDIVSGTAACEEVKKSKKFAKILELILLLGNYMNSASKNGPAFGFQINFLTKLTNTKDLENKQTLLHYIVDTVEKKFPDLIDFYDEMPHIDRASRVSLDTIQKTLKQMDASIKNLETDLQNNKLPQNDQDKFSERMGTFAKDAREQCMVMQKMFKKMDELYSELAEYYAFDKQKYVLEEFFADLKTFKDSFIEAKKDNEKEREIIEKNRKAKLAREKAEKEKKERAARKKALIDMNPSETQEGVMDSLLEALQTGSAFSREQKRKRGPRPAGAERRAQLVRSRSRTGLITGRELTGEIIA